MGPLSCSEINQAKVVGLWLQILVLTMLTEGLRQLPYGCRVQHNGARINSSLWVALSLKNRGLFFIAMRLYYSVSYMTYSTLCAGC